MQPYDPNWIFEPAIGNVLLEPQEEEERTESGLFLVSANGAEKETHVCKVIEVCPPYNAVIFEKDHPGPIYAVGDLVVTGKYNGRNFRLRQPDGTFKTLILVREADVLCKLKERSHVLVQ